MAYGCTIILDGAEDSPLRMEDCLMHWEKGRLILIKERTPLDEVVVAVGLSSCNLQSDKPDN